MNIGKAGSTSLDWNVFNVGCNSKGGIQREICHNRLRSSSKLSDLVQKHFHIKFRRNNKAIMSLKGTEFVFSVREPLSRFPSWFRFQPPRNCRLIRDITLRKGVKVLVARREPKSFQRRFWYDCFPKTDQMARALNPNNNISSLFSQPNVNVTDCRILLHKTFTELGYNDHGHLTAGYRYYCNIMEKIAKEKSKNKTEKKCIEDIIQQKSTTDEEEAS